MYASLSAPPRADLDAATFLPLGVAHERVVDDGMPGVEPVATPPAYRAHALGHDRILRRSPPKAGAEPARWTAMCPVVYFQK